MWHRSCVWILGIPQCFLCVCEYATPELTFVALVRAVCLVDLIVLLGHSRGDVSRNRPSSVEVCPNLADSRPKLAELDRHLFRIGRGRPRFGRFGRDQADSGDGGSDRDLCGVGLREHRPVGRPSGGGSDEADPRPLVPRRNRARPRGAAARSAPPGAPPPPTAARRAAATAGLAAGAAGADAGAGGDTGSSACASGRARAGRIAGWGRGHGDAPDGESRVAQDGRRRGSASGAHFGWSCRSCASPPAPSGGTA